MIKKYKKTLIVTSIILILPVIAGLILWNQLPAQIATHWDAEGVANGFSSKAFAVFGIPAFIFVMHWICILVTSADPKYRNIYGKPLGIVFWICPITSLVVGVCVYAAALKIPVSVELIMPLILGVMFIIIGNYLPKCQQNYTLGIKLPWTLHDEENWNRTHRFAGPIWIAGGIIIIATSFLKSTWIMLTVVLLMVVLPTVYSFMYYRKNRNN